MITGYATLVNATSETLNAKLKIIHNKFLSKYSQYNKISVGNFYIRIRIDKTAYWNYIQVKQSYLTNRLELNTFIQIYKLRNQNFCHCLLCLIIWHCSEQK